MYGKEAVRKLLEAGRLPEDALLDIIGCKLD